MQESASKLQDFQEKKATTSQSGTMPPVEGILSRIQVTTFYCSKAQFPQPQTNTKGLRHLGKYGKQYQFLVHETRYLYCTHLPPHIFETARSEPNAPPIRQVEPTTKKTSAGIKAPICDELIPANADATERNKKRQPTTNNMVLLDFL